jgi:2',3'-cyclic-nucleotide 2'-phosphodiesterase (5'-nucleotidase family)
MKAGLSRWSVAPVLSLIALSGAAVAPAWASPPLEDGEKLITILATNDIHGGIEARPARDGKLQGGLDFWAGAIRSVRQGLESQLGSARSAVLVLDAGDQFQGTLLSNFNEGRLAMEALNTAGLDAAVPGNHDYDFGPVGWLEDQVTPGHPHLTPETDPRGALKRAIHGVKFPLLSANTYLRSSIRDWDGNPLEVDSGGCRPRDTDREAVFLNAERPDFLKPYEIVERAGVRIALIGLDHEATASMTTQANVSDLCFRDSVDSYIDIRNQLEGKADLFILLVHGGNAPNNPEISHKVEQILDQSGSGGEMFGRIDLVWNPERQGLNPYQARATAGIRLLHEGCSPFTEFQCREETETRAPILEGVRVEADAEITEKIELAAAELAPVGQRILGRSEKNLSRDRIGESPLSNALTDAL